MPINLSFDLRFRRDRTLAQRLAAAFALVDRLGESAKKPAWWDAFHANRMRRSFIRHRLAYRVKARLFVAWMHLTNIAEGASSLGAAVVMAPIYIVLCFLAPRSFPRPREAVGEYDAFMLKCKIEDLLDEIQRRVVKREAGG